jgi:two-component system nitrate/nitrite response regulator NarL
VASEQQTAPHIRIFIIDDHPTIVWGLERLIESEAPRMVAVGKAASCGAAMTQIEKACPDVVLLDLDLGEESGLDAIPALLAKSSARILVLTGLRDTAVHEAAIRAGALGVVGKEIAPGQLLETIARVHRGELSVDSRVTERLMATISPRPASTRRCGETDKVASLTARERDIVLTLMTQPELALKSVAGLLGISERTLRNHLSSIYEKLGVSGRLELYVFSSKHMREQELS